MEAALLKLPCFALSFLMVACRLPQAELDTTPENTTTERAASRAVPPLPFYLDLRVQAPVSDPDALRSELQEALLAEMKPWGLQPLPPSAPKGRSVLQLQVEKYETRPAESPLLPWGAPGIASAGAGVSVISSASGAGGGGVLAEVLVGLPLLGAGIAFIVVGSVKEGLQIHRDRARGYPLHVFKARARLDYIKEGEPEDWHRTYRSWDLSSGVPPLSADASKDPANVRREMLKALARTLRKDVADELN
jgi:hypothetical protein